MLQQHELQDQTNWTLPVIRGFAELLTFVHQWDSPRLDTQCSNPHKETIRGEEVDSPVEEAVEIQEEDSREEEAADSQAVEDLYKVTLTEDHQGTDL